MMVGADPARSYSKADLEAFNILQHPVWVFDIERKEMWWANRAALEIWGAESLEALLARNFAEDMTEATERRMQDHLNKLVRGEIMKEQWTYYPKGKPITLGVTGSAIWIDGGRCAALAEAELPDKKGIDDSSVRGVELLRHMPIAVSQFGIEGELIYQNPEAVKLFGVYDTEREKDGFLSRFVDRELGRFALEKVKNSDEDYSFEAEHYTQAGGARWFSISIRRSKDPVTFKPTVNYSARDITEIVQARKQTKQATMKSEFMAVMAHEIRTPLHQVIGCMDLFQGTELTEQQAEYVRTVQDSTSTLMALINDLIDYDRLENNKLKLEFVEFDAKDIVTASLKLVEPFAKKKHLVLRSEIPPDLPVKLNGDPNRVGQVLSHVLHNAIKFTERGSVTLKLIVLDRPRQQAMESTAGSSTSSRNLAEATRIRFEVIDTGIGVETTKQELIFEKYRQANTSVARNYGGTGLGLAFCKSLLEAMGGTIGLRSDLGKGTTVSFEIPFECPEVPRATKKLKRATKCGKEAGGSLRVLVVEDNQVNQKLVKAMLTRIGHNVTVADNGQVAVDEVKRTNESDEEDSYDLVLMDVQMPIMDGIEATREIRKLGWSKSMLPIVGLTASFDPSEMDFYLGIGMNTCLGKPIRMKILQTTLAGIRTRAEDQDTSHLGMVER